MFFSALILNLFLPLNDVFNWSKVFALAVFFLLLGQLAKLVVNGKVCLFQNAAKHGINYSV